MVQILRAIPGIEDVYTSQLKGQGGKQQNICIYLQEQLKGNEKHIQDIQAFIAQQQMLQSTQSDSQDKNKSRSNVQALGKEMSKAHVVLLQALEQTNKINQSKEKQLSHQKVPTKSVKVASDDDNAARTNSGSTASDSREPYPLIVIDQ